MMDYYTYTKPKLWANVICAALLYVLFAYAKLKRLEKSITDERQLIHAERRQGLIITLFSNATAMLGLLLFLIHSLLIKGPAALDVFFLFCAVCFGGILILTIQNLRRLDR